MSNAAECVYILIESTQERYVIRKGATPTATQTEERPVDEGLNEGVAPATR